MSAFKHTVAVAVEAISSHLGEAVSLDGHCIRGIPRLGTTISGALAGVQVRSTDASVSILNVDADRIGLRKGMDMELRGKAWTVRDFTRGNSGWTVVELE